MGLTAMDSLLEVADHLYGLTLPEFTPARDAAVKQQRSGDRELAQRIKELRKPSLAAWTVNLLVRRDPAQVDQILAVGEALREAQAALSGDELRALTRQRRQLTAAVTTRARALAAEHGQRITPAVAEQVEATLTAAMVDAEAAAAVRSGLLVGALTSTGLEPIDLSSSVAVPQAAGFSPTGLDAPVHSPPQLRVVPDPDAEAKRRHAAEHALAEAETALAVARDELSSAQSEASDLEAQSLQLQAEIDELRRQLEEHEARQDDVDAELEEARDATRSARAEVATAEAARDRAAQALDRL